MKSSTQHARAIVPILAYHSVSDGSGSDRDGFTVGVKQFAEHLSCIADEGYTALGVSEFAESVKTRAPLPARPILLTFDDGYADFSRNALPLLSDHRFASTLYVITGRVVDNEITGAQDSRFLSWAEVGEIDRTGVEIGSHSVSHPQLDVLTPARARAEIQTSRAILEARLGHSVRSFAYPYGYHGPGVRRMVVRSGYESACAIKEALSASDDDVYALSRILVRVGTHVPQLRAILRGEGLRVAPSGERLATIGWRYVRKSAAVLDRARARGGSARAG